MALVTGGGMTWVSVVMLVAGGIAAALLMLILRLLPERLGTIPVIREFMRFSRAVWRLLTQPSRLISTLGLSVLIQTGMLLSMSYLGWLLGAGLTLSQGLVVYPAVLLVSLAPVSIAGWGVREGAMVIGLGLYNVHAITALSISLLFGFVLVGVGLVGGLIWELGRFSFFTRSL